MSENERTPAFSLLSFLATVFRKRKTKFVVHPDGSWDITDPPADLSYAWDLLSWDGWFLKARDLFHAASLMEPRILAPDPLPFGVYGAYFMLVAFGIENLCKGQIVRDRLEELRAEGLANVERNQPPFPVLPKFLKEHNLLDLAEVLRIDTNQDEEELLRRLTDSSVWSGRYPVPRFPRELTNSSFSDDDVYRIRALIEKIRDRTDRRK